MGLRERLLRLAEVELRSAARRLRGTASGLFGAEDRWRVSARPDKARATPPPAEPPEIQRYYANLELPLGASAEQVKAAYRRLMRQYHPDRHASDPERAMVAHQVAQELRAAYEGLLLYLGDRSP